MTIVTVRWGPQRSGNELLDVAPIQVNTAGKNYVIAPGESVDVAAGETVRMMVDLPRLKIFHAEALVPHEARVVMTLDAESVPADLRGGADTVGLSQSRESVARSRLVTSVLVDVPARSSSLQTQSVWYSAALAEIRGDGEAVTVSSTLPVSVLVRVASRVTPHRLVAVPFAGQADNRCEVRLAAPVGLAHRLRVEPADSAASLLMDYLTQGKFRLACVAARAVERARAEKELSDWSQPSFAQLLIGYSYALGGDGDRLAGWCRRTDAAINLGPDGVVLTAELARRQHDPQAPSILGRLAEGPTPTLMCGLALGLSVATAYLSPSKSRDESARTSRQKDAPADDVVYDLRVVRDRFLRLLTVTDGESSSVSVPESDKMPTSFLSLRSMAGIRWLITWFLSSRRHRFHFRTSQLDAHQQLQRHIVEGLAMTGSPTLTPTEGTSDDSPSQDSGKASASKPASPLTGPALWVAIVAVALWIVFSLLLVVWSNANEVQWTRIAWVFGSVEAVAFAAAGALFGTAVQRQNVDRAEARADSAQQDADAQRSDAIKGRALATALQADAPRPSEGEVLRDMAPGDDGSPADPTGYRHAQMSRALFGDLL